jgi:hypothetical protein
MHRSPYPPTTAAANYRGSIRIVGPFMVALHLTSKLKRTAYLWPRRGGAFFGVPSMIDGLEV